MAREGSPRRRAATLTVDVSEYAETVANTEARCTAEEAGKRGTSMTCERHSRQTATAVP